MTERHRALWLVGGVSLAVVALLTAVVFFNRLESARIPTPTPTVLVVVTPASSISPLATPTSSVVAAGQAQSPLDGPNLAETNLAVVEEAAASPTALVEDAETVTGSITETNAGVVASTDAVGDVADAGPTAASTSASTGVPTVIPSPTVAPTVAPTVGPTATPTLPPPVSSGAEGIPVYGYEIVEIYPHDPQAFTQGLQYMDGELYEGTGLYGRSSLRRVDLETGEVLEQVNLANDLFGEGIAVLDDRIYQLTWQAQRGFVYDRATFERTDEFSYSTEGWGLTVDGEDLVMSDGTNILYWRDPDTFAVERQVSVVQVDVPIQLLNELEYVEGEVFANVWQTNWIVRIDPATGRVIGWIDLTGLLDAVEVTPPVDVLNGIAYDAEEDRLFVTGKLWPALFEIDLVER